MADQSSDLAAGAPVPGEQDEEAIPPGWMSVAEISASMRVTTAWVRDRLREGSHKPRVLPAPGTHNLVEYWPEAAAAELADQLRPDEQDQTAQEEPD